MINFYTVKGAIQSEYIEKGKLIEWDCSFPNTEEGLLEFMAKLAIALSVRDSLGLCEIDARVLDKQINFSEIYDINSLVSVVITKIKEVVKN